MLKASQKVVVIFFFFFSGRHTSAGQARQAGLLRLVSKVKGHPKSVHLPEKENAQNVKIQRTSLIGNAIKYGARLLESKENISFLFYLLTRTLRSRPPSPQGITRFFIPTVSGVCLILIGFRLPSSGHGVSPVPSSSSHTPSQATEPHGTNAHMHARGSQVQPLLPSSLSSVSCPPRGNGSGVYSQALLLSNLTRRARTAQPRFCREHR